ncbi:type II toxin-antitoxin system VapC family toxin [Naumannella huperziae]
MASDHATLVDSNVLLDVLTEDADWLEWSENALATALDRGPVVINPIVYAEVSIGFDAIEDLEDVVPSSQFMREALPWMPRSSPGRRS